MDGEDIAKADPVALRRRIGYVIQQVGLFPHKTVLENTSTVPHLLGWQRKKGRERAAELLDLVGLDPSVYGDRYPDQLSGGQRQRVGVARALAADPPVLLMDEPFGAVDPVVREHLQTEFLRLQSQVRKTVLFVTHDIEEAVGSETASRSTGSGRRAVRPPGHGAGRARQPVCGRLRRRGPRAEAAVGHPHRAGRRSEQPPVVHLDDPLSKAAARLASEARWAVVLDDAERLHGWIPADAVDGRRGPYGTRRAGWRRGCPSARPPSCSTGIRSSAWFSPSS
ncbi:ABC transporter ATP-binding protein OS=Streptomyces antimycoticus OX=68175 GN=SANT12839_046050 PE=3 SV=1 [Streptomyces antimycoticus]